VNAFNYTSPRLSCDKRNKLNLKNIFKSSSGSEDRKSSADEVEATTVEDSTVGDPEHEEEVEESTVGDPEEEVATTTRRPFRPKRPPPHKRPTRRPWGKQCGRRCKGHYRGNKKQRDDGWRPKRFYGKKGKNKN
jgi:hypothetical protein